MADTTTTSGQPIQASGAPTEGQPPVAASKDQTPNLLEGIDLDELPTEVREKLSTANTEFQKTHKSAKELEQQKTQLEGHARNLQSKADRATSVLQKHNLSLDGNQQAPTQETVLKDKFIKDGLKPEIADQYVKMFMENNQLQNQNIMGAMAPLAQTVAELQATQILHQVSGDYKHVFAIPEVAKHIQDNVSTLLRQGNTVDRETVQHLVKMAWGEHALSPAFQQSQQQQMNQQTQIPNFGSTMGTGGVVSQPNQQGSGVPRVTQPETMSIVNAITAEMKRELPKKK